MLPTLNGIDHIHLYVSNKQQAAQWYATNLGFKVVESMLLWDEPNGPLTIEDQSGQIHLALFEREKYEACTAIAFKTSGEAFIKWKFYLEEKELLQRCSDHHISWSLYFSDPFGHSHEITTYQVDVVNKAMQI